MSSNGIEATNNVKPIQRSSVLGSMFLDSVFMGAMGAGIPYVFTKMGKDDFVKEGAEVIKKHKDNKLMAAVKEKLGELFDLKEQNKLEEVYKNNKDVIQGFKAVSRGIKNNRALASFKWTIPVGATIGLIFGLINRHSENKAIKKYEREQVK